MPTTNLPAFPYGAVYFRKSNPPREDWARDYQTAREDGMNIFRHWFLWSAIEVAPGEYDWEEYDRQLDLAAEPTASRPSSPSSSSPAPEWAFVDYAHARFQDARRHAAHTARWAARRASAASPACASTTTTGASSAERFLRALATRYKGHPGPRRLRHLERVQHTRQLTATARPPPTRFQAWLQRQVRRPEDARAGVAPPQLRDVGGRQPPRAHAPYPDVAGLARSSAVDNAHGLMRWRRDLIRSARPDRAMTAHGAGHDL